MAMLQSDNRENFKCATWQYNNRTTAKTLSARDTNVTTGQQRKLYVREILMLQLDSSENFECARY